MSRWPRFLRQMAANPIGVLGAGTILVVALVALVANALAPFDPTAQIARPLQSPGGQYLLGTDEFGRDVLSRLMFGSRISLYVGLGGVSATRPSSREHFERD
jgi:peptide/nickel transport system permease protein